METLPLRGQQDGLGVREFGFYFFDSPDNRLGLHDHAGPAPIGIVIRQAVLVFGEVAQVSNPNLNQTPVQSLPQEAFGQRSLEDSRENRQDIKDHLQEAIPQAAG